MTTDPQTEQRCICTGTSAGLNACTECPTPWPDIPGATRIRRETSQPAAPVAAPPTGQTGLRDRIAALFRHPPGVERLGDATPGEIADAVLALLFGPIPAGTDTATWTAIRAIQLMNEAGQQRDATPEPHRLALSAALGLGTSAPWDAIQVRAAELATEADRLRNEVAEAEERAETDDRVMDALNRTIREQRGEDGEAQQPSPRCTCGETACESELCDCDSTTCPVDHAAETPGPETQGVQHAPGTAILCPDCHAKGYSICMDGEEGADYEATTGHAVTCLAVAGGASDPDCPACNPQFGIDGCTCIPFTRQTDPPRYLNRPTDTVDMISGWEPGADCPHHAPPTPLAKIVRWVESEPVTANTEFGNGYRECQRDIRDLLKGRFDYAQPAPPAVATDSGKGPS